MPGSSTIARVLAALTWSVSFAVAEEPVESSDSVEAIISVADQRLVVIRDGMWVENV